MTRLGPHINNTNATIEVMFETYVSMVKPPWAKFLDGAVSGRMTTVCRANGTKMLGRKVFGENEQKLGAAGGRNIGRLVEYATNHPEFDAIEGYNECYDNLDEIGEYAQWSIDFMAAMENIHRKAAIGCFSTGTPEPEEWEKYLPAIERAWSRGHYLVLHEYGAGPPGMRWGAGRNQWNNGNPVSDDPAVGPDVLGWWTLRYRRGLLPCLRAHGLGARIIIGESGLDNNTPRMGGQGNGWRDFMTAAAYAKDTVWYGRHLTLDAAHTDTQTPVPTDSGIHGWVGFGDGSRRANGDPLWKQFDIFEEGDLVVVARQQLELPRGTATGVPLPPPAPAPVPPPAVPPAPSPTPATNLTAVVLSNESWYAAARRIFNLPINVAPNARVSQAVRALAAANGLNYNQTPLVAGQVLKVPGWATLWPEEYHE